jgi:hypothetical protein
VPRLLRLDRLPHDLAEPGVVLRADLAELGLELGLAAAQQVDLLRARVDLLAQDRDLGLGGDARLALGVERRPELGLDRLQALGAHDVLGELRLAYQDEPLQLIRIDRVARDRLARVDGEVAPVGGRELAPLAGEALPVVGGLAPRHH